MCLAFLVFVDLRLLAFVRCVMLVVYDSLLFVGRCVWCACLVGVRCLFFLLCSMSVFSRSFCVD